MLTEFPCEPKVDDLELVDVSASAVSDRRRRRRRRDFPVQRRVVTTRSRSAAAAADPVGVLLVSEGRRGDEDDVLREGSAYDVNPVELNRMKGFAKQ